MTIIDRSRRVMLRRSISLAALASSSKLLAATCGVSGASDGGMRAELHYVELGPEPGKHCSACAFLSNLQGACGTCQILNGPANADGHCDSWTARG